MRTSFSVNDMTIHRIVEQEAGFTPMLDFLPTLSKETLGENLAWLAPGGYDSASGNIVLCFQSYVVKTPHHNILVDSCIGNDKNFPLRPTWNKKTDPNWMRALKAAGLGVEDIDFVMCTHLHWDHVGWNTRLADGKWVPTFPKARYIMAQREYDHWQGVHDSGVDTPHARAFGDSILPVVKTGQALLVGDDYALDDGLWFEAYRGHTPGNVVIHANSAGERGVFIGDVLHHPLQCLKPEWSTMACTDPVASRVSRTRLLAEHADSGTLVMPAHFPDPTAGWIRRHAAAYRFDFRE